MIVNMTQLVLNWNGQFGDANKAHPIRFNPLMVDRSLKHRREA